MQYKILGSTGWKVSAVTFGAWQIGDPAYWGGAEDSGVEAVRAALDAGINFFDTAEMYGGGESERALGCALRGARDKVHIASKILPDHCKPGLVRNHCEASLERLGTDYIDLYQIHWPFDEILNDSVAEQLLALKSEGKIRAIGISNFGCRQLGAWCTVGECVSNQLGYNLLFRAIEDSILPECRQRGIGILVYMPLLQGLLSGRWSSLDDIPQLRRRTRHFASFREGTRHGEDGQEALLLSTLDSLQTIARDSGMTLSRLATAWLIAQPGITSVIVGAKSVAQVVENAETGSISLDEAIIGALDAATRPLKAVLGPNPDMWLPEGQSRIW